VHSVTFSEGFRVKAASRKNIVVDAILSAGLPNSVGAESSLLPPMFQV
jgi:hypothetical protein